MMLIEISVASDSAVAVSAFYTLGLHGTHPGLAAVRSIVTRLAERRELAAVARSSPERRQQRNESPAEMDSRRERRLETCPARMERIDADHLGRLHLSERQPGKCSVFVVCRSRRADGSLESAARHGQSPGAEAEHVVAVAGDRWFSRLRDDRHRNPERIRLQGAGAVDA